MATKRTVQHTTQDLVFWLGCRKTNDNDRNFLIDAIIARLRNADKYERWLKDEGEVADVVLAKLEKADELLSAAKKWAEMLDFMGMSIEAKETRKAIAKYEGKEE